MARRFPRRLAAALLAGGALFVSGCGGSDKPGYCADRAALEQSVKDLTSLNPSAGISGLQSSLQKIQTNANRLVASAQSDFPSQTSAIRSSVTALANDVRALPSNPSASSLQALAADAANAVGAIRGFVDATSSKCD